jgi:hypothetical protein
MIVADMEEPSSSRSSLIAEHSAQRIPLLATSDDQYTHAKMAKSSVWSDIQTHRRAYLLTAVASFGGMLFGWDTGLIGGWSSIVLSLYATKPARRCLDDGRIPTLLRPQQQEQRLCQSPGKHRLCPAGRMFLRRSCKFLRLRYVWSQVGSHQC